MQAIQSDTEVSSEHHAAVPASGPAALSTNLLVIPIEKSLLYVRPLYVASDASNSVPQMQQVIVAFQPGGAGTLTVKIADTLQDALTELFGSSPPTRERVPDGPTDSRPRRRRRTRDTPDDSEASSSSSTSTMRTRPTTPRSRTATCAAATQLELATAKYEEYRELLDEADDEARRGRRWQRHWLHRYDHHHHPENQHHSDDGGRRGVAAGVGGGRAWR